MAHTPTRNRRTTDLDETSDRNGAPATPADLRPRSWFSVLKRTVAEFRDDNLTDWAAALTYYTVLSVFPALIALVSIVGLAGQNPQTTNALLKIIDGGSPLVEYPEQVRDAIVEFLARDRAAAATAGD